MWKKCMLVWCEAHLEVKSVKAQKVRAAFGSCDVEKVHAVVVRSTHILSNLSKHVKITTYVWATLGSCDVEKSVHR